MTRQKSDIIFFYFNSISVFTYCRHTLYPGNLRAHREITVGMHQSVSCQIIAALCENSVIIVSVHVFSVHYIGAIQTFGNSQDCYSQLIIKSIARKKRALKSSKKCLSLLICYFRVIPEQLINLLKNVEIFLQICMIARRPMSFVTHEDHIGS